MSVKEIIEELPRLTEAERRAVPSRLRELAHRNEDTRACDRTAQEQAAALDRIEEQSATYRRPGAVTSSWCCFPILQA